MMEVVKVQSKLNVWASFSNIDDKRREKEVRPVLESSECAAVTFNLLRYLGKDILTFPESNKLLFLDAAVVMISKNYLCDLWLCSELNALLKRGKILRRPFVIPIFLERIESAGVSELLSEHSPIYLEQ